MEAAQRIVAGRPDQSTVLGALVAQIDDAQELWEENAETVEVFIDMLTQLNVGPGGLIGLRYESIPVVMDLRGIPAGRRADIYGGLRLMERAALEQLRGG